MILLVLLLCFALTLMLFSICEIGVMVKDIRDLLGVFRRKKARRNCDRFDNATDAFAEWQKVNSDGEVPFDDWLFAKDETREGEESDVASMQ